MYYVRPDYEQIIETGSHTDLLAAGFAINADLLAGWISPQDAHRLLSMLEPRIGFEPSLSNLRKELGK